MTKRVPTLIMITGAAPGAGKTTLANGLAAEIDGRHLPAEELIFERAEFRAVGDCFRHKVHPGPTLLEDAYGRLVTTIDESRTVVVLDGSFVDLAEDLSWAMESEPELHAHSRRMRKVLSGIRTVTVFVDADVTEGIRRREAQHGREWFSTYDTPEPGETWERSLDRLTSYFTQRLVRIRRAFAAADWPLAPVDGNRTKREALEAAVRLCAA